MWMRWAESAKLRAGYSGASLALSSMIMRSS
jgi:hypothetical protein